MAEIIGFFCLVGLAVVCASQVYLAKQVDRLERKVDILYYDLIPPSATPSASPSPHPEDEDE